METAHGAGSARVASSSQERSWRYLISVSCQMETPTPRSTRLRAFGPRSSLSTPPRPHQFTGRAFSDIHIEACLGCLCPAKSSFRQLHRSRLVGGTKFLKTPFLGPFGPRLDLGLGRSRSGG